MNLVSVIIPYYKKKKYFSKTISSVLAQTYKNLEIIIVIIGMLTEIIIPANKNV